MTYQQTLQSTYKSSSSKFMCCSWICDAQLGPETPQGSSKDADCSVIIFLQNETSNSSLLLLQGPYKRQYSLTPYHSIYIVEVTTHRLDVVVTKRSSSSTTTTKQPIHSHPLAELIVASLP